MRFSPLVVLLAAFFVLASCTVVPVAPASPTGTGTYASARAAFDILIERHVDKPSSQSLLEAATRDIRALVGEKAPTTPLPEASYTGDSSRDFEAFTSFLNAAAAGGIAETDLERSAVNAMAKSLDECHTYYLDPERAKAFNQPGGQRYSGIGAQISPPEPNSTELPEIARVFSGTPAESAGLRAGDRIKTVDGNSVAGLTAQEVADRIKGPTGTSVELVIIRNSAEQRITIVRANIVIPLIEQRLQDNFGWVTITQIASNVPTELTAALGQLDRRGAQGWILDLRGNPGGDLTSAQMVGSTFIRSGVLVYEVGRDGDTRPLRVMDKAYYSPAKPLAVLVDENTASGAEIVASAVMEHGVGRVFGQKTAGCVGIGQPKELPDGGILLVTIARMRSAVSREDLNGRGVVPDEVIEAPADRSQDPVLDAAIAWLRMQTR
jgi:carboxyl-terminal processing protease